MLSGLLVLPDRAFAQSDPLLQQQWHLRDPGTEPAGANVLAVWPSTKGAGIVIGIVDDGIQGTHPDLSPNINAMLSTGFNLMGQPGPAGSFNPPQPISCNPALISNDVLGDGCRGTAVAGIAAARDNTIGGSGVAPRATIAALRLLDPTSGDFFSGPGADLLLAGAIGFNNAAIHIKNFSWGPSDDGATLFQLGPLALPALGLAASTSRGGKGTVFVRAAGDGGPFDNCNFDGFASSRFVIAVGAVGDDALPAPYSEACSALFVVAPSSGGSRGITTTDLIGDPGYDPASGSYTDRFGGTAAAAPVVSGVVALMLATNPSLTARDVKHILVRSSAQLEPGDPGWSTGPFPHHELFGFGLVDAAAAVATARTWTLVDLEASPRTTFSTMTPVPIPDGSALGVTDSVTPAVPGPGTFTVEHVEVIVDIDHPRRGDLEISLTSPHGVVSHLTTLRPNDTGADLKLVRFGSVRHWGEDAAGAWTLRVADRATGQAGTFNEWRLVLHGTAGAPALTASGRVTTSAGAPLSGVTVTFARVGGGAAPATVQTDADGRWAQSGFAADNSFTATPGKTGFSFNPPSATFDSSRNDLDFVTVSCPATPITLGANVNGTLATTDCRATQRPQSFADRYTFTTTAPGHVALALTSTAFDTFLYLFGPNGFQAFNDDSGNSLNSRIPANGGVVPLPTAGTYTIEATSFRADAVGAYNLSLTAGIGFSVSGNVSTTSSGLAGATLTFTRQGGGAVPGPVETDGAGNWSQTGFTPGTYTVTPVRQGFQFSPPSRTFSGSRTDLSFVATPSTPDGRCLATPIASGQTIAGTLTTSDCLSLRPGAFADRYTFSGTRAQQVSISLTSPAFDTFLYLIGPATGTLPGQEGPVVTFNDDSGNTVSSRIPPNTGFFTLPSDGTYTIEATSFTGNVTGPYTLNLTTAATTGFRVAGQVVTGAGVTPLTGTTLTFSREASTGPVPTAVQTDAAGSWSQSGFIAGTVYRVTPSKPGYVFTPGFLTFSNTSVNVNFTAALAPCVETPLPSFPRVVTGSLATTDCLSTSRTGAFADRYTFAGTQGQQIAIDLTSTAFDTYLLFGGGFSGPGGSGAFVTVNDDSGGSLNSRIPINSGFFTLEFTGTYSIEVTSFAGGVTGPYTLTVTTPTGFAASGRVVTGTGGLAGVEMKFEIANGVSGPVPRSVVTDADGNWTQVGFVPGSALYRVVPIKPGYVFTATSPNLDTFLTGVSGLNFAATVATNCTPLAVTLPTGTAPLVLSGTLTTNDCRSTQRPQAFTDRYVFNQFIPRQVAISVTSTAFDTFVYLLQGGMVVASNDDSGNSLNSRIPAGSGFVVVGSAVDYTIEVTSAAGGATGAYTLTVAAVPSGSFVASGQVTAGGLPQPGVTVSFTEASGRPVPAPVVSDANGFWSQTFAQDVSGPRYRAAASRATFEYFPSPSPEFTGPTTLNFVGSPAQTCPRTAITFGQTLSGMLQATDCRADDRITSYADRYTFSLASPAPVVINVNSTTFDTYVYLRGLDGIVAVDENDDFGDTTDSRLSFTNLAPGNYEVQVTSFSANALGAYTISLGPTPGVYTATGRITNNTVPVSGVTVTFARPMGGGAAPAAVVTDVNGVWSQTGFVNGILYSATPSKAGRVFEPTAATFFTADDATALDFEAICPATPIAAGQTLSGTITATDCRAADDPTVFADRYVFMGSALSPVAISMSSTAFDTFLVLYGPDGALLATNDDSGSSTNSRIPSDSTLFFELPQSGQYVIEATPLAPGLTGAYTVSLTAATGGFETFGFVTTDDGFTGVPGATVTFTKLGGPGAVPAPTTTDVDGFWFKTGFVFGATYRARVTKPGLTFSPPFYDFAGDLGSLDFFTVGSGCAARAIQFGQTLTGAIELNDCRFAPGSAFYDLFTFTGTAGAGAQITVDSDPSLIPVMRLFGPDGLIVDADISFVLPSAGGFLELPLSGTYSLEIGAFGGPYSVTLTSGVPGLLSPASTLAHPLADESTAAFWTPVGSGAADGGGISADPIGVVGPPSIAVDPVNGDIYAAWESGNDEIYVRRWNGAAWVEVGNESATNGGVSNNGPAASRFPSIAVMQPTLGQPGVPVVAWLDQSSGNWEVFVKAFNPVSSQWDPAGDPDAASGGGISHAGPGAIAVPEDARPTLVAERSNLFVAWATNGGAASTHRAVVSSLRPFTGWAPLAAAPVNANVAVPALEYGGAPAAGYSGARLPSIGINRADGNPLAVYVTGNTNTAPASTFADVHVRRWTPSTWASFGIGAAADTGISNDGVARGAGYMLTSPRVAVGPDGVPHAAWLYSDASGARRIQVRRFSSSANAWLPLGPDVVSSDVFLPPLAPGGGPSGPSLSLTVGRDSLPIVAWSQGATTGNEVYVRKFSPIIGWHELGTGSAAGGGVSDNIGFSRFPAIAVDTHNNLNTPIVAWLDNSSGLPQIYVRRAVSNADLVIESVTAPSTGAAGQPVDVSAVVRNRGTVATGAFGVGLFLSTNNTIDPATDRLVTAQQVSGLAAGAQATVTARVTLPVDVEPGAYFFGAYADIGQAIDEVDEANNGLVGSNGMQVVGPDLVVTGLNGPFTATPGQRVAIEVTVKNQAAPPGAAATSRVAFYLSPDQAPAARSGTRLGIAQVAALAAGASQTLTPQLLVPANLAPGSYNLAAYADDENQVGESDESDQSNNFNADRRIEIVRADIAVTQVTAPASSAAGQTFTVSSDVKNQAAAAPVQALAGGKLPPLQPAAAGTSNAFRLNFYLSPDGSFNPMTPPPLLGGRDIARLAPGVTSRATTTLTVPANTPAGTYVVVGVADVAGAVQEQNENNNVQAASNPMVIRQPDLRVTEVNGPASRTGAAGQALVVTAKVKNEALAPANAGTFRVGFYLSLSDTPGPDDLVGFVAVPSLAAGVTTPLLSATITVPGALLDGTYFLSAIADYDNRVVEANEGNNKLTTSYQITIARPDLVLASVAGPASGLGAAGQPLAVTASVKNQSPPPANAGPFKVGFYLSTDNTVIGPPGVFIGSANVTGLAAGATATASASLVVPTSVTAGTYFLSAVADFDDRVAEASEGNNGRVVLATSAITIRQPDLAITKVTGPASGAGAAGQRLAVTVNVRNIAAPPANAGPFKISLYLSNVPDATQRFIGSLNVVGALASGLPLTISGNVVVPPSTPADTYYLSAVADVEGAIPDLSRANNLRTADGQIAIGQPDLRVTRVAGPVGGVGAAGQPMTVSADIKNEGPALANAGPFRVGFYLSDDVTPGTGTLLGAVNVPGLAAGARITLSPRFTVPSSLAAGGYFLVAVADLDNVIVETDKDNNALAVAPDATVVIRQPNLAVLSATLTPPPAGGLPASVVPGQTFVVTASVRNTAEAPAIAGSFRVGAYLSTAPTGANPTLLGFATVASLAASTTTSVPISIKTLPPSLAPGLYYLVAIADDDGRVTETDEADNTFVSATPLVQVKRADLVVATLSGPASGLVGKTISVSNTIVNQGTAPATAVRVSFFVSLLDATPGAGRLIGTRDIATLGATGSPTASSTATTTLTLPANLVPGSYFLSAVVDLGGTIAEGVETNNGFTAAGQIVVTTAAASTH